MACRCSIIIPTFQRPHLLRWGLASIAGQDIPFEFETIVVNDGVIDETENICREFQDKLNLRYIFSGQRNGDGKLKWRVPGFAFNIGVKQSSGDVLIFTCPEIFHLNDAINNITLPVLENPNLITIPRGKDDQFGDFLDYISANGGSWTIDVYNKCPDLCVRLPFLMGVSRSKFFSIGGYDEDFTGLCYDDDDLVHRLSKIGCIFHQTEADVVHLFHPRYSHGKEEHPDLLYNKNLFLARLDQPVRNQNREWGLLNEQAGTYRIKASILITTFKRAHLLKWGLHSLAKQNIPFEFETIVLNDGITDETELICAKYREQLNLKYIFTGHRNMDSAIKWRIPGFAYNIGARQSSGQVLILTSAEMFHVNDTIAQLTRPVLENPKLLAVPEGKDDDDGSLLNHIVSQEGEADNDLVDKCPDLDTRLPYLMAVSRQEFFSIGGYDEDFTGAAADDNDLVDRLVLDGCSYIKTGAKTVHLYHDRLWFGNEEHQDVQYNRQLYYSRKGRIVRNEGREWGLLNPRPTPPPTYKVSVIITCFQRPHLLLWALYTLARQKPPFDYEVIVVNDGANDITQAICEEYRKKLNLKYIFAGHRNSEGTVKWRIPGFAFNIGVKHSSGDVLVLSCAEMFHVNDTLMELAYPPLVNPKLIGRPQGKDDTTGGFLNYLNDTNGIFNENIYNNCPELPTWLPFLLSVSRDQYFSMGGYDEDFTGIAWDDNDFIDRLLMDGCTFFQTGARTVHLYHPRIMEGQFEQPEVEYNMKLYLGRKGKIIRNKDREWGIL